MAEEQVDFDPEAARARIRDVLHRSLRDVADQFVLVSWPAPSGAEIKGVAARTPGLPMVYSLNQIRITSPIGFDDAMALTEALQSDMPYRRLVIEDGPSADAVLARFGDSGWQVERDVQMVLCADADRAIDTSAVVELDEDEMLDLVRSWIGEMRPGITPEHLEQVVEYSRREGRLWGELRLGVRDAQGGALCTTKLRSEPDMGWVEDVYTVPEARGRGYARATVTHAVDLARASGATFVFVVADAEDWPQHLYRRIGFRPVGGGAIFTRHGV
ncbi:MAG: GNAT family N-acetyltransferase [Acidimicrobiales bacterium]